MPEEQANKPSCCKCPDPIPAKQQLSVMLQCKTFSYHHAQSQCCTSKIVRWGSKSVSPCIFHSVSLLYIFDNTADLMKKLPIPSLHCSEISGRVRVMCQVPTHPYLLLFSELLDTHIYTHLCICFNSHLPCFADLVIVCLAKPVVTLYIYRPDALLHNDS